MRGKRTYGGQPGQRVEEQGIWASHTQKHSEAGYGRPVDRGAWTAKTVKRPRQQPAHPQYANYWAPLTRKRHIPPHSAQPQHTNDWAPRTRKRHQQEHRPQRPTERSNPTQHAKGRTGDCPGPRKGATTRRNVTQGGGVVAYAIHIRICFVPWLSVTDWWVGLQTVYFAMNDVLHVCRWVGYPPPVNGHTNQSKGRKLHGLRTHTVNLKWLQNTSTSATARKEKLVWPFSCLGFLCVETIPQVRCGVFWRRNILLHLGCNAYYNDNKVGWCWM